MEIPSATAGALSQKIAGATNTVSWPNAPATEARAPAESTTDATAATQAQSQSGVEVQVVEQPRTVLEAAESAESRTEGDPRPDAGPDPRTEPSADSALREPNGFLGNNLDVEV